MRVSFTIHGVLGFMLVCRRVVLTLSYDSFIRFPAGDGLGLAKPPFSTAKLLPSLAQGQGVLRRGRRRPIRTVGGSKPWARRVPMDSGVWVLHWRAEG